MPSSVQKTLTDAGYIAVGLGVMGFQQAQIRARAARVRVSEAGSCVAGRARDVQSKLGTHTQSARTHAQTARTHAQTARTQAHVQVRHTVVRASELRDELGKRVEPVVGQVQAQLGELPERVVQAMEPVAARVREIAGNAA
jgi:hypothetical protein